MDSTPPAAAKHVIIYTDGGADPNPGKGGYGVVLKYGTVIKELCGGFKMTTNNRMELLAAAIGLEALKQPCHVTLHSDSKYLVDAFLKKSVFKWRRNGWWRTVKDRAKNADLWERIIAASEGHQVTFQWVRGHAGNPMNERCDVLATKGRAQSLLVDEGYLKGDAGEVDSIEPGHPCFQCGTPFVKRASKAPAKQFKGMKTADWHLHCPGCQAVLFA